MVNTSGRMDVQSGDIIANTTYHRNGDPHVVTPYQDNKIHGLRKQFLVNGIPDRFEEWKEGVREGITTVFQDGQKHSEIPYSNDKKNGVEIVYNTDGQVVGEITWKEDLKSGVSKTYIQDVVRIEWYYKGKKVSKSRLRKIYSSPKLVD